MSSREDRLVRPFYLSMMGLNAIHADPDLLHDVVAAGLHASVPDVVHLLRDAWRPRVMGAWFSLLHEDETVASEVQRSLATSYGSLTAPALTVAAVLLAKQEALAAMSEYISQDLAHEWGAAGFVAAATVHVGGQESRCQPDRMHTDNFEKMLAVGKLINASGPRPD